MTGSGKTDHQDPFLLTDNRLVIFLFKQTKQITWPGTFSRWPIPRPIKVCMYQSTQKLCYLEKDQSGPVDMCPLSDVSFVLGCYDYSAYSKPCQVSLLEAEAASHPSPSTLLQPPPTPFHSAPPTHPPTLTCM